MKLEKASIDILVGAESTTIEIMDKKSRTVFVSVELTPDQLSQALSRIKNTPCEVSVNNLDRVGKTLEHEDFEFKMPDWHNRWRDDKSKLHEYVTSMLSNDWVADGYFGSQNSFFTKDGEDWGRCTIRRWV